METGKKAGSGSRISDLPEPPHVEKMAKRTRRPSSKPSLKKEFGPRSRWWIKTIHALRPKTGMDEEQYRMMLDSLYGKTSSTELNYSEAMDFVDRLKAIAENKPVPAMAERGVWLSPAQRRKIEALCTSLGWLTPERELDKVRLHGFIMHQIHRSKGIEMLLVREAQAVITGLERIYAAKQRKEQREQEQ